MRIFLVVILGWLLFPHEINAQAREYRQYSVKDGLPSTTVYDILQDKKGFMWFATENGLCRFDGKNFKTYTIADGLTDNTILNIFEDSKACLWIISFTGKLCFLKNRIIHNPDNDPMLAGIPFFGAFPAPCENQNGDLFFARGNIVLKVSQGKITWWENKAKIPNAKDSFVKYQVSPDNNLILINNRFDQVHPNNVSFYFYTNKCIYQSGDAIQKIYRNDTLPANNLVHLQKQVDDDIWIFSMDKGAYQVTGLKTKKRLIRQYLNGIIVMNAYKDKENNIWFATKDKGLFFLGGNIKNSLYLRKSSGLPQEDITVLSKDKSDKVWAGATKNNLYCINNLKVKKYVTGSKTGGLNYYYDLACDSKGRIFCAKNDDVVLFDPKSKTDAGIVLKPEAHESHNFIGLSNYKSLSLGIDDKLLVTTPYALLMYEPGTSLGKRNLMRVIRPENTVRILTSYMSRSGEIWLADNNGLNKLEGTKLIPAYTKDKILKEPISRIAELNDGNLIICTRSKGIVLYDGKNVLQVIGEAQNLASDICNRIFIEGDVVWIATSKGISKLVYKGHKLYPERNFTVDDGFISDEINDVAVVNDTIYAATSEGLSIVPESKYFKDDPPDIYFNKILNGISDITDEKTPRLNFSNNYIKFNFIGITYQQPQKLIYKYHLAGTDDPWIINTSGSVDFPELKPGDYTFEIMAKKITSDWSKIKQYQFSIVAPFWMSSWFSGFLYSMIFLGTGLFAFAGIRIRNKQKRQKISLKNRMFHLEQQAQNALMNPHFIFNALNSIQQYLQKNDTVSANKYLSLFAKLTRKNMEAVMKSSVSLEDELERLELYLVFEKQRFGDKLNYFINVPPGFDTDEVAIPPMILQPFVENAIWHGIMPLAEGGSIFIYVTRLNDKQYSIKIKDTGMGIDASKDLKKTQGLVHKSKGMQLTMERLELWALNLNSAFELKAEQGELLDGDYAGTTITMILPLPA